MDIFSDQRVAGQSCGSVHSMKKKCLKNNLQSVIIKELKNNRG
jgi:hypothetical protein